TPGETIPGVNHHSLRQRDRPTPCQALKNIELLGVRNRGPDQKFRVDAGIGIQLTKPVDPGMIPTSMNDTDTIDLEAQGQAGEPGQRIIPFLRMIVILIQRFLDDAIMPRGMW